MLLANLPGSGIIHMQSSLLIPPPGTPQWTDILNSGGLADMLYMGVKLGIYPPLIFLGIGTMTDFGPLISTPKACCWGGPHSCWYFQPSSWPNTLTSLQRGGRLPERYLWLEHPGAGTLYRAGGGFRVRSLAGIEGTAIYVTTILASGLLSSIAVAAYSYMALEPVIQPPIVKALTTSKERSIVMTQLRARCPPRRSIIFPILCTIIISLILPDSAIFDRYADAGQPG